MIQINNFLQIEKLLEWDIEYELGLTTKSVNSGEVFLKAGQRCNYLFFILKGFVRIYYYDLNSNEMTHWFASQNSITTSPFSFFKNEKNILYHEAMEDTELVLMNKNQLNNIIIKSQLAEQAFRSIFMEFGMIMSERVIGIHTETAEERYLKLLKEYPYVFEKAKLSHIASYLGITPQSLSRIRKHMKID